MLAEQLPFKASRASRLAWLWPIAILGIAAIALNLRMIRDGLNGQVDLIWHVTWLQHFSKQLLEGSWYPRWLAGTNYGYGSPTFVFYPPLVYYAGTALKALGLSVEQTVTVLFSLAIFLSGLTFYLYGKSRWSTIPALAGALAYMGMPYLAFTTYQVGSLSSMVAIAWLPLGWWLTEKTARQAAWGIGLALFWTMLTLTHMPTLLICFIGWLPCIFILYRSRSWTILFNLVKSAALGIGMASFYLLPALLEKKLVNIDAMKDIGGGFRNMMIGSSALPILPLSLDYGFSHVFIHQALIILILTAAAVLLYRVDARIAREGWLWFGFAAAIAFFISSLSWPLWQLSPTLQRVQSSTRLLPIFSFQAAALLGLVTSGTLKLRNKFFKLCLAAVIALLLLANFSFAYKISRKFPALHNPGRANLEYLDYFKTALYAPHPDKLIDVPEYRPLLPSGKAVPKPVIGQPRLSVVKGQADTKLQAWQSYHRAFQAEVSAESLIRIRTYYYPGWQLWVNGQQQTIEVLDDGTIGVRLLPGSYAIRLGFQRTAALTIGLLLSFVCAVYLVYFDRQLGRFWTPAR
ncbi:MAG: hypothetical protein F6J97_01215 [Leptolyngbya sp. SIO4C1]|nr:hypothetical protein [Leptolyngbya sp. SIO4C1]